MKKYESAEEERLLIENARLKRQLAEHAEELAILKKTAAYFAKSLKYAFMQNHLSEFKITSVSHVLGVSRSGFYRFRQRAGQPAKRQQQRMVLDKHAKEKNHPGESYVR